jgi:hypothetical protein
MLDRLDEVSDERVKYIGEIERDKLRVATAYNKRVKQKLFQVGDLVLNTIFPIGSRSNKFGKWSPNWEGPYRIKKVISGNSYMVQSIQKMEMKHYEHCTEVKFGLKYLLICKLNQKAGGKC